MAAPEVAAVALNVTLMLLLVVMPPPALFNVAVSVVVCAVDVLGSIREKLTLSWPAGIVRVDEPEKADMPESVRIKSPDAPDAVSVIVCAVALAAEAYSVRICSLPVVVTVDPGVLGGVISGASAARISGPES